MSSSIAHSSVYFPSQNTFDTSQSRRNIPRSSASNRCYPRYPQTRTSKFKGGSTPQHRLSAGHSTCANSHHRWNELLFYTTPVISSTQSFNSRTSNALT